MDYLVLFLQKFNKKGKYLLSFGKDRDEYSSIQRQSHFAYSSVISISVCRCDVYPQEAKLKGTHATK